MAKRKCPRDTQQDGICGCPLFWKRPRAKAISNFNIKDMSTPSTTSWSVANIIDSDLDGSSDLHHRKRQKREDDVFPQAGGVGLSSSKSARYMGSKLAVEEYAGQKQDIAKMNTRAQENESVEKKAKANTPIRILVDYELPAGAERLDWDTDEVRRTVGEIAQWRIRVCELGLQ